MRSQERVDKFHLFFSGTEGYNFGGMKFDVIVGNPPFNPPKKSGRPEGNKIWHLFIERAFGMVKEGGHLLFVTPNNWRLGDFRKSVHRSAALQITSNLQWYRPITEFVNCDVWHAVKGTVNAYAKSTTLSNHCLYPNDASLADTFECIFGAFLSPGTKIKRFNGHNPRVKGADGSSRRENNDLVLDTPKGDAKHPYRMLYTTKNVVKDKWDWSPQKPEEYDALKVTVTVTLDAKPTPLFIQIPYGIWGTCNSFEVPNIKSGKNLCDFFGCPLVKAIQKQFNDPLGRQLGVASSNAFPLHLFLTLPTSILNYAWDDQSWQNSAMKCFSLSKDQTGEIARAG